jgi:hypothetical protein
MPKEFSRAVSDLLGQQFKGSVSDETFLVESWIKGDELLLTVSLAHPKSLRAANILVSQDVDEALTQKPEAVTEQLKSMVDVAGSWFHQCFEAGKGLDTIIAQVKDSERGWQSFQWEGKQLWVNLNLDNLTLEKAADDFLRTAGIEPDSLEDQDLEELLPKVKGKKGPLH